jgi:nucleotide-binding universal stress UspA family protein
MLEIKTVVTPIDFSENAQKVTEAAVTVAVRFEARLKLVFIVQNFDDYSGFFVPPVNLPNLEEELYQSAQRKMDTFVDENKELFSGMGLEKVDGEVRRGDVAEEILSYAIENSCDLIVMGTHGYKGIEKVMFGSVADKIVKNSCCPVLTINPYRTCEGEK